MSTATPQTRAASGAMPAPKAPPLLLGAALLFWAAMTGLWLQGAGMALALEGAQLTPRRVALSRANVVRAADLSLVLLLAATTYLFLTPQPRQLYFMSQPRDLFFLVLGEWTPMCVFPMAALMRWGDRDRIPVADLLAFLAPLRVIARLAGLLRRLGLLKPAKPKPRRAGGRTVNLELPFLGVVLLAAGCSDNRAQWYFAALALFTGWALWGARSERHGAGVFLLAMLAAAVVGFPTQAAIHAVQDHVRQRSRDWPFDPLARATSMGDVGALKLSHDVVFRLRVEPGSAPVPLPLLLREGAYNYFNGQEWMAMNAQQLDAVHIPDDPGGWRLVPPQDRAREAGGENVDSAPVDFLSLDPATLDPNTWRWGHVTIYQEFVRRSGLLALPMNTALMENLPVGAVRWSTLGQVKAESTPGLAAYTAYFDPGYDLDEPPVRADTYIPEVEREAVAGVARDMGLDRFGPENADQAASAIKEYLAREYRYTLVQDQAVPEGGTALSHFLLTTRAGHCEHFAAAAVMLLRQAGIPARYATGYMAHEYDAEADLVLVRANHGHAWTLYRHQGQWRVLDATPPVWITEDAAAAPWWQPLSDFRAKAVFYFATLRWLKQGQAMKTLLIWALAPLLAFLAVRLALRGGVRLPRFGRKKPGQALMRPGLDSPLYRVEALLAREAGPRPLSTPLAAWLTEHGGPDLSRAAALHNRLRFDPRSLDASERRELDELAAAWLSTRRERGSGRRDAGH